MAIDVREHVVTVGAKGVGKTTILRLLNFVLGASLQQLYQYLSVVDVAEGADTRVAARLEDFVDDEGASFRSR